MKLSKTIQIWLAKLLLALAKSDTSENSPGLTWANALRLYKQRLSPEQAAQSIGTMTEDFKLSGVSIRPFGDQELRDYMVKIRANAIDPKKKSDWNKDKMKYPHFHNSSIGDIIGGDNGKGFKGALSPGGNEIDIDKLKTMLSTRPNPMLMTNKKAEHSTELVYMLGMPALKGMAVDEETNELYIVDTCPGAGTCKLECYAMGGSYIIVKGKTLRYHRLLTFLLNDPDGFKRTLSNEIVKNKKIADKKGRQLVIRWHDSGDFFSPDYFEIARELAEEFPEVKFAAYTKMGDSASAQMPYNFVSNFSVGATPAETEKVDLEQVKLSVIVPKRLYQAHIIRAIDYNGTKTHFETKNGKITNTGKARAKQVWMDIAKKEKLSPKAVADKYPLVWDYKSENDWIQVRNGIADALNGKQLDVKPKDQMLPKYVLDRYDFDINPEMIITWQDMITKPESPSDPLKWSVVVLPNTDGDDAAQRKDVWISFLLIH